MDKKWTSNMNVNWLLAVSNVLFERTTAVGDGRSA